MITFNSCKEDWILLVYLTIVHFVKVYTYICDLQPKSFLPPRCLILDQFSRFGTKPLQSLHHPSNLNLNIISRSQGFKCILTLPSQNRYQYVQFIQTPVSLVLRQVLYSPLHIHFPQRVILLVHLHRRFYPSLVSPLYLS